MSAKIISRFLQSRAFALVLACLAIILSLSFGDERNVGYVPVNQGLLIGEEGAWLEPGGLSWFLNIIVLTGIVMLLVLANRQFKLIKANTWYFAGLFFIIQLAFTPLFCQLSASTLLTAVVLLCTLLLFSTFANPKATETVFLLFLIISVSSFWISAGCFFIPVFILGMAQMRTIGFRTLTAMLLGLITPYWIIWGFELRPAFEIHWPHVGTSIADVIAGCPVPILIALIVEIAVALFLLVATTVKSLNYNAGRRAFNGFFELLTATLIFLVFVDASNFLIYVTMINAMLSFQAAHLFSTGKNESSYITFLLLPAIFIGLAIWNYL